MSFKLVVSVDEEVWRGFVDRHPQGNIFHTPEMFQVFERARGYHPRLYAAVDDDGQMLALLLPVQVTLINGPLRRLTTRAIAYGSAVCSSDTMGRKALAALLDDYTQKSHHQILFTELRNQSDLSAIQPVLQQCGYTYEEHLNFLIDIQGSPEQILQNIGSRTRKHIRQTLRKGLVVAEELRDHSLLPLWYELVHKTYNAARIPLADYSLFDAAFNVLQPRGMVQFWVARVGQTYVAASAELLYKDVIYGWYSGVDRAFAAESPGELLMWCVLERGSMAGFKTYDFGGAGRPNEVYGVRDFKAKFGGQLVCFGRNTKIHSPHLLRWSKWGYQFFRQLLKGFSA